MSTVKKSQSNRRVIFASLLVAGVVSTATTGAAQNRVLSSHTFPHVPIKEFQNKNLKDSVHNDRKVLLGSVGSDLWHEPTDPRDEFYDGDGNNVGKGKKTQILIISLAKPLPLPQATVSVR